MNGTAPQQFKFNLKDDYNFNNEILVYVMHLDNRNVLHVVDSSTTFQEARFLPSLSAKDTWETLCLLWIDSYQEAPDIITHDARTNFVSMKFRNKAKIMGVTCKQVPIEAYWSIGKIEGYHLSFRLLIRFCKLTLQV